MANAYRVKHDVSFPRVIAHIQGEGEEAQYETTGENYPAGSFIKADSMTPRDRDRAENGDLDHLLEPLSDEEYAQIEGYGDHESTIGIFIPEHEAERHALRQAGHITVSREQELDLMSQGAEVAAQYQGAVKEHGLDRRPVQEYYAQEEERIPDEILHGSETRTGLPHNVAPVEGDGNSEASEGSTEQPSEASQTRPRPGAEQQQTQQPTPPSSEVQAPGDGGQQESESEAE